MTSPLMMVSRQGRHPARTGSLSTSVRPPVRQSDLAASRRLLRSRRERPRGRCAAEKGDEFPPPHGTCPTAKDHGRSIAGLGVGPWRAPPCASLAPVGRRTLL